MDITHFNPRLQDEASFLAGFVARQSNLNYFLKQLALTTPHQPASHHLIVAPRGYGKTSLLRRIAIAIRTQPDLHQNFVALSFREEQHNILSLDFFWHNCLVSLLETRELEGAPDAELQQLEALADAQTVRNTLPRDAQDGDPAWQALLEATSAMQRRPVLLIDNLDSLLRGLPDAHQWQLRRVLQAADGPVLVAASSAYPESTSEYKAAFYDFFRIHTLDRLTDPEVMHCLAEIAKHRGEPGQKVLQQLQDNTGRIAALNTMAGGNPRTLGVLYKVLEAHMSDDIFAQLGQMLDTFTGWYQARTEELPTQARAVFDALALNWDPITAAALAQATGLDTPTVSSQISRLEKSGHVEAVKLSRSSKGRSAYQVAERFYNIWYLMRNGSLRTAGKVRWLTAFLQGIFTAPERKQMARELLSHDAVPAHYALALSSTLTDSRLQRGLLRQLEESGNLDSGDSELSRLIRNEQSKLAQPRSKGNGQASKTSAATGGALGKLDEGVALAKSSRYIEAEAAFRQAIALDAKDAYPWNNLGNLLQVHLGRYEEAEAAYRQAIAMDAKYAVPWNGLGNLMKDHLSRYDEAEAAYRQAIAMDAKYAVPWNGLGNLLQSHLGRYDEAEAAYRQAIALDAKNTRLWFELGYLLHVHFSRYDEAVAAYRQAIALDANDARLWHNLGYLLKTQLGRYDEAEAAYRQAIALDAKLAYPWSGLGHLLHINLGRYEEAETAYREAIALDAKDVYPWSNLGNLLKNHLGRFEEAEAAYREAIALGIKGLENSLGNLLLDCLGRPKDAITIYEDGLSQQPEDAFLTANLAYVHALRLSEQETALQYASRALRIPNAFSSAGIALLQALPCHWTAPASWGESWRHVQEAIETDDQNLFNNHLDDLQRLLSWFVSAGQGEFVLEKMQEAKFPEKYAPVYHAMKAAIEGEDYLLRINPETRAPALKIYTGLARMIRLYPPLQQRRTDFRARETR